MPFAVFGGMRSGLLFLGLALSLVLGTASCKSEECGGCRLRYCDAPAGACDCGCFDGDVVNGATCKDGCFVRPSRQDVDCSNVGCAPPPLCATGCTEACGCCSCADGEVQNGLLCVGGCYAPADMM
jgi:hypothetical protein